MKLSDFGISKELDSTTALSNTSVGSNPYMSPERLEGDRYDASSDVWSVGISIIELWRKKYPFVSIRGSPIDLCGEIKRFRYDEWMPDDVFPPSMKRFLISMLAPNPEDRATSYELTTSPWLESCRILSLEDAQMAVQQWLMELDSDRRLPNRMDSKATSAQFRGISAVKARDLCEMSMSLDASKNSFGVDELAGSRSMNNPFTSSGNFFSVPIHGTHAAEQKFGGHSKRAGAKDDDDQEYEEDFEDVEPMDVDTRYEYKRSDANVRHGRK